VGIKICEKSLGNLPLSRGEREEETWPMHADALMRLVRPVSRLDRGSSASQVRDLIGRPVNETDRFVKSNGLALPIMPVRYFTILQNFAKQHEFCKDSSKHVRIRFLSLTFTKFLSQNKKFPFHVIFLQRIPTSPSICDYDSMGTFSDFEHIFLICSRTNEDREETGFRCGIFNSGWVIPE